MLNSIDYGVIVVYFLIVLALGVWMTQRASGSLEDYFLGGKKQPWYLLGLSGSSQCFDITGSMMICSFLYMLGPRGMYIEFRGGVGLVFIFMMLWTGKWHRRSNCMTGAEWMIYRFGPGAGGEWARVMTAVGALVGTIGMLAYLAKGVGLFLSMFIPFSPWTCALIMVGIATAYTILSGFYGVVVTDVFQSLIMTAAVVWIAILALGAVTDVGQISALALKVTGNVNWIDASPSFHTTMPAGYEQYENLFMFMLFYLIRNIIGGVGSGGDPRYFAARNERECGKLTFFWVTMMTTRWILIMSFAILGLFVISEQFPDLSVVAKASSLIHTMDPEITRAAWGELLSNILNHPEKYPPAFITELHSLLGTQYESLLQLVSFDGNINPERVMPAVIIFKIPMGMRGLILVAMIAAAMSTFDATVNSAGAYFVRDIYQRYLRPNAKNRELIWASYGSTFGVVVCGVSMGMLADSVNDIWGWLVMGLGAAGIMPSVLRLHWWRFNGAGMAFSGFIGLIAAFFVRGVMPTLSEPKQFIYLTCLSLVTSIIGAYLFKPTNPEVLRHFYRTTRPFGFWGPVRDALNPEERADMRREVRNDLLAIPFAFLWQVSLLMLPLVMMIHAWKSTAVTFSLFSVGLIGLYFFWYKNLPPDREVPSTALPSLGIPFHHEAAAPATDDEGVGALGIATQSEQNQA